MSIHITPQRQDYFDARGKIVLNACPGSGKTTCIVHKLALLEQECQLKYGLHAGIACLSFTNVARHEIAHKYRTTYGIELGFPHVVSTIDSFINQFISLPFYNLIDKNYKRPRIVDDASIIDNAFKTHYIQKGQQKEGVIYPLNTFKSKDGKALFRKYPPSSIWIDRHQNYTFEGKLPSPMLVDSEEFKKYGKAVFRAKLKKGLISSQDSALVALHLINKYERIGAWLAKRFPYLIIDEAQDTSEIQHAIFDKLIAIGLPHIELVGDPYQSLYEWRDAKPHLFLEKFNHSEWKGLLLSQNRRSVQRIIDCFSIVRQPGDDGIDSHEVDDLNIPLTLYKYNATNPAQIIRHFEDKCSKHQFRDNHIVVRGNTLKDQMLGNAGVVDPWKTPFPSLLVRIRHAFETNSTKTAVDDLRKMVTELSNKEMEYGQIKDLLNELHNDYSFNGKLYSFLYSIPPTTLSFLSWSDSAVAALRRTFDIGASDLFQFKTKITGHRMTELKAKPVNLYFNKSASHRYNFPITTIHQVKGATLDALLYFFDETSGGQSVSFNDFKSPEQFPTEKQRIIYVACSRPRQLLALAFPDKISDAQLKQRFGNETDIIKL
jgi:superfamily I DNA/RNA helicase